MKNWWQYSGRPPINPLTLSFASRELQQEYSQYHLKKSLKLGRIGLLLGAILYTFFAVLDRFMVPEAATQLLQIRICGSLFLLSIFGLTFTSLVNRYFQFLMSLVILGGGLGIVWLISVSEIYGGYYYYAGIMLAFIYAHGLLRLRFIYASLTTWIVLIIYELTVDVTPPAMILNNTFFLVSCNLLGMFSSYGLEYYMRAVFWQSRMIQEKGMELENEYKRKSRELEAARQLQLAMLPQQLPEHPEYEFSVSMKTATEIGGDYYDFHMTEDGTLTFALGDATGHGAQAGAMVAAMKILFSDYAPYMEIVDFLKKASYSLRQMGIRNIYMAFVIGRLNKKGLEIVGAGMPAGLIYRSGSATVEEITLKGLPLGSYGDYSYHTRVFSLRPGDTLLLMTDGFPELFNAGGEMLGYEQCNRIFTKTASQSPARIIEVLNETVQSWLNGHPQEDDTTFLVIQKKITEETLVISQQQQLKERSLK